MTPRRFATGLSRCSAALCLLLAACTTATPVTPPLAGGTIALLGEVHDNAQAQRERLAMLREAVAAGWRPAIAMEQFDTDRQADIDRARREAPRDAQRLIDAATPARSGWDWALLRPVVELALQYDLPLVAANLSGADTTRIVRGGYASVFDAPRLASLGLTRNIDPAWQAAQEREIDAGHCGMLPAAVWPAMARAQFARDAVMAAVIASAVRDHAARGVVLIAGNGHVRRDIGVPRWLTPELLPRVLAVGYLEPAQMDAAPTAFDRVVRVPAAEREDPCIAFRKRATP